MTIAIVAALEAVALAVTVLTFAQLLRSQQRAHARREDLLINQLLHATGQPWQPAPATETPAREPDEEPVQALWTATPEQFVGT